MASYRFMSMQMEGNRIGTDSVEPADFLAPPAVDSRFAVAPLEMRMDMHMVGVMFAPSDKITLMAMLNWVDLSMDHLVSDAIPMIGGTQFTTKSSGFSDTRVSALYQVFQTDDESHRVLLNLGLSIPTGSIDEEDFIPVPPNNPGVRTLPYPMQTGSGTWDVLPGITYRGFAPKWSWGAQLSGEIRLGSNDADYTLGNQVKLTGWVAKPFTDGFSASIRFTGTDWGAIDGQDSRIATRPMPGAPIRSVPTAQPELRGGQRLDLGLGLNLMATQGPFKGHRLALEWEVPIHQDLDGPQLETDWILTLGWQKAW